MKTDPTAYLGSRPIPLETRHQRAQDRAHAAGSFVGWLLVSIPLVALLANLLAWALRTLDDLRGWLELLPW
jgi:hypothetical protein